MTQSLVRISALIFVCLAYEPLSANSAVFDAKSMSGDWYGGDDHGVISIEHYKADGSFVTEFRQCFKSGKRDHIESGHWSISNGVLHLTTDDIRDRPTHLTSEEKFVSFDQATLTREIVGGDAFRMFGPGFFKAVRVTADSKLPGCDASS
jgi:hypothetical protein